MVILSPKKHSISLSISLKLAGVGFSRANLFGKYFERYNEEAQAPLLIAQIEHINAVDKLDDQLSHRVAWSRLAGKYYRPRDRNAFGISPDPVIKSDHVKDVQDLSFIFMNSFDLNIE